MVDIAIFPRATAAQKKEMAKKYRMTVAQLKKGMPEMLHRVEELHEFKPDDGAPRLPPGHHVPRGHRDAGARHLSRRPARIVKEGGTVVPEVMIPLIGGVEELQDQGAIVRRVAEETIKARGVELEYLVGTMIEIPRAALTAVAVAEVAEFFSFGTNDLTQMTYGYCVTTPASSCRNTSAARSSRADPFVSVDQEASAC